MPDPPTHGVGIVVSTPEPIDEKAVTVPGKNTAQVSGNELFVENACDSADAVIITGADVASHILPMRDDFDPTLTFRAAILGSGLAAFLAVMTQIYTFKPTQVNISGVFLVLVSYFIGTAWAKFLPRGDRAFDLRDHCHGSRLFYDLPLSAPTVILGIISIGLFGCGLCGFMRFFAVWDVEAVYWDSVSIPCLASQKAAGKKGAILTNLFGGATANEGLGLFSLSFDWQYITSSSTANPLNDDWYLLRKRLGFKITPINADQPAHGQRHKISIIEKHELPQLSESFAFGLFTANAAIGALIPHCILFWGKGIWRVYRRAREGKHDDPHHTHMAKHCKDTPWWCFAGIIVLSFVLGLIVVIKEKITLPVWAYIVALALAIFISPFSVIFFARFGNGIATNNLSKMLAGLMLPGRPVGNMYFAAWSHNIVISSVSVSTDLKLGEYLKIPPRTMLWAQMYGIVLGGFINYAILSSIISANRDLLIEGNGNSSWSGTTMQAFNTKAAYWALAPYLYKLGAKYEMIPIALAVGAAAVVVRRLCYQFIPKVGQLDLSEINLPQFIQYAGNISTQPQTCTILSGLLCGLFTQAYLRNYHPRIFRDYSYIIAGAFDAGSLFVIFILSFAVYGAGGPSHPFPLWWGNNQEGHVDWCPISK
ncbi:unnamed protein product [Penicillium crustosum]